MATCIGKIYNQCVLFIVGSHIICKVYTKIIKNVFLLKFIFLTALASHNISKEIRQLFQRIIRREKRIEIHVKFTTLGQPFHGVLP